MMINSIRKMFMNAPDVRSSQARVKFLDILLDTTAKYASKYFMRGTSKYSSVTLKLTPMMSLKEIKLHPEAIIDISKAPKESVEYLRIFCDVMEVEILSAYKDAQEKLYKKAEISSESLTDAE